MELRRLGDPVFKPRTPLLSFLIPSVSPSWRPRLCLQQTVNATPCSRIPSRSIFTPTARRNAESSTSTAADPDFLKNDAATQSPSAPTPSSPPSPSIDDLLGIFAKPKKRGARENSASDIDDAFQKSTIQDRESMKPRAYYESMNFPTSNSSNADLYPSGMFAQKRVLTRAKHTIRSRPSIGRTIEVDVARGTDFGRAMQRMNTLCARNRIRADLVSQKYHERPGSKRKRLKSQRWRKLFKEGFKATVNRVKEMKRQGW